jgi:hypothetical protein
MRVSKQVAVVYPRQRAQPKPVPRPAPPMAPPAAPARRPGPVAGLLSRLLGPVRRLFASDGTDTWI